MTLFIAFALGAFNEAGLLYYIIAFVIWFWHNDVYETYAKKSICKCKCGKNEINPS